MKTRTKKKLIPILIFLIIAGGAYLGINIYIDSLISKTTTEEDIPEPIIIEPIIEEVPKGNEVVNFMLVGADNLDQNREASYVEQRSDVFKIISLDYTEKKIKITSLDRDVVVWIPDKGGTGEYGHFNWAYSFGKAPYAINAINYNLDLDVTKYVTFSFAGFIRVIDILGGIDIELSAAEAYELNSSSNRTMYVYEGMNHLDGFTALNYARIRHLDSDFVRMERQNVVIQTVINQLKDSSFMELLEVANESLNYISTNLSEDDIKKYIKDLLSFDLKDIKTHTYPSNGGDDVCVNPNSLGGYLLNSYSGQVIDLHKFIYGLDDYKPSQRVYDNEKKTYDTFGDYYEGSYLIP